jgi:hypothetical protein
MIDILGQSLAANGGLEQPIGTIGTNGTRSVAPPLPLRP